MSDNTKDTEKEKKSTSSKVSDSRIDKIKQEMGVEDNTPEEPSIIDGQMGLDELLQKEVDEDVTENTTPEEVAEIKKETKQKLLVQAGLGKNVIQKSVDVVMHESMMPYSEHVILDRALPRVEDGLKPVQRRILYSMMELGVTPDKPYRKSARIVGDCLGKYHPHGDTSVYDAMVRMAQSFNMGECLVDGHGNFGSVDGDGAAAMRYTEARMAPLALEMLRDLDKGTVDWNYNFDDTLKEPATLSSRYPNLLVNGATGIAVGLATNIPPHNLAEAISGVVAYIDNPKITLKEMMKHIKGPDFPTGGSIIAGEELVKAYETGKGKILIRAKVHIEKGDNDKKTIVITELPYQVNKSALLTKILELRDAKKTELAGIAEICDESDRNGMRAVIRVKKDFEPEPILNYLFKYTNLQVSYGINLVAVADKKPRQLSLLQIVSYYVNYQREIIYKRTKFDLDNAKEREHILLGLVIAVKNIDEVVKIIKTSENTPTAKKRLMDRFKLSDRQAQAILDLRLARLTSLEVYKLEQELAEVQALIKKLTEILGSTKLQFEIVKNELNDIKKRFKKDRQSNILSSIDDYELKAVDDKKPTENIVIGITKAGTIKQMPAKHFSSATKEWNDRCGDTDIFTKLISTTTDKQIIFFTNLGNAFKMYGEDIPESKWREKGLSLSDISKDATPSEYPVAVFEMPDQSKPELGEEMLLFLSSDGMIKKTAWKEYYLLKNYYQATKFKDGDNLIDVQPLTKVEQDTMVFVTKNGFVLNAFMDDIPVQGRISGGVKGIMLAEGDKPVLVSQASIKDRIVVITDKGYAKKVKLVEIEPMARYRKGVKIIELNKTNNGDKLVYASLVKDPYDLIIEDQDGNKSVVNTDSLDNQNRTSTGKSLGKSRTGVNVKCVNRYKNAVE